jgi:hypothetical protein
LSEAKNGEISIDEALLLITCLGINYGGKYQYLCDLSTGLINKNLAKSLIAAIKK